MLNPIQEIKDRLNIEDLVGQYVQLKKVGRSFKGLCPFHAEKTPSFIVSPERQIAYCFGCNKGGDIFSFIQESDLDLSNSIFSFTQIVFLIIGLASTETSALTSVVVDIDSSSSFAFDIQNDKTINKTIAR